MKIFQLSAAIALALAFAPHAFAQNAPHRDDPRPQPQPQSQPQPQPTTAPNANTNANANANTNANTNANAEDLSAEARDAWITTKVKSALLADEDVSGLKIDVDTRDGVVVLSGQLGTQKEIAEARRIAQTIDGVKRVDVKQLKRDGGNR